jgi:oligo-1,6-glucosidase
MSKHRTYDEQAIVTVDELPMTPEPEVCCGMCVRARRSWMWCSSSISHILGRGRYDGAEWSLPEMKRFVVRWQAFIGGTDGWTTVC